MKKKLQSSKFHNIEEMEEISNNPIDYASESDLMPKKEKNDVLKLPRWHKLKPPPKVQRRFWKTWQNELYVQFLENHIDEFNKKHDARSMQINLGMSYYIGSRTAKQCRSHHQKMQGKWGSEVQIIRGIRAQLAEQHLLMQTQFHIAVDEPSPQLWLVREEKDENDDLNEYLS